MTYEEAGAIAAYQMRLKRAVQRIAELPRTIDYLEMNNADRKHFEELVQTMQKKRLDEWNDEEKAVYKFWQQLPKLGMEIHEPKRGCSESHLVKVRICG
jgi:hypothetical protein